MAHTLTELKQTIRIRFPLRAAVAKSEDALHSGCSELTLMGVQVPPAASGAPQLEGLPLLRRELQHQRYPSAADTPEQY